MPLVDSKGDTRMDIAARKTPVWQHFRSCCQLPRLDSRAQYVFPKAKRT